MIDYFEQTKEYCFYNFRTWKMNINGDVKFVEYKIWHSPSNLAGPQSIALEHISNSSAIIEVINPIFLLIPLHDSIPLSNPPISDSSTSILFRIYTCQPCSVQMDFLLLIGTIVTYFLMWSWQAITYYQHSPQCCFFNWHLHQVHFCSTKSTFTCHLCLAISQRFFRPCSILLASLIVTI